MKGADSLKHMNDEIKIIHPDVDVQGDNKKRQQSIKLSRERHSDSMIKIQMPNYIRFSKVYPKYLTDLEIEDLQQKSIQVTPQFAWIILLINMAAASFVPCWLMYNLDYELLTRNSWRFLSIAILTTPFVAFQKRKIAKLGGQIKEIMTLQLIKMNFIGSINLCIWFLIIKYACFLTSVTHAFVLVNMNFFIQFIFKRIRKQPYHEFQNIGTLLVIVGLSCILYDTLNYKVDMVNDGRIVLFGLDMSRIIGNGLSITGSIVSVYFEQNYKLPKQPRFLNILLLNAFLSFNFVCFGYFFAGSQLSFNEYNGVLGILDKQNFLNIFYVSIMLGFNLIISHILITQIFSQFILKIANCFTILLTSLLFYMFGIQKDYLGLTYLSFGFILPGLILMVIGQNMLQNKQAKINFILYKSNIEEKRCSISSPKRPVQQIQMKVIGEVDSRLFSLKKMQLQQKN